MTENTVRTLPMINTVDGFNPPDFTRHLPNDDGSMSLYMDVKYRLLWFRLHHPDGKIAPEIIRVDEKSAIVCCKVYASKDDAEGQYLAKSNAQRFATQDKYGDRYLETAETAALGRALAAAGYGTQFCGAADMFGEDVVDAPIDLGALEESCGEVASSTNCVMHETKQPAPQPTPPAQGRTEASTAPAAPTHELTTLEDYLNTMTLEDAKKVKVDVGYHKGSTLGDIALRKPGDLEWYVKHYSGRNLPLKAGAILLVDAARKMAS